MFTTNLASVTMAVDARAMLTEQRCIRWIGKSCRQYRISSQTAGVTKFPSVVHVVFDNVSGTSCENKNAHHLRYQLTTLPSILRNIE